MPSLFLDTPAFLLLSLPLAAVLVVARRRLRAFSPPRRGAVLFTRALMLSTLVLALAGAELAVPTERRAVVFAVDVSGSMTPEQRAWARDWVERARAGLRPGDAARTIEFAERAVPDGATGDPSGERTSLQAALRLARETLPHDRTGEVVLVTDGWENAGDALAALPTASTDASPAVSFVASLPTAPEVGLVGLEAPPRVRDGDRPDVVATIRSTQATDVTVRLEVDGRRIAERRMALAAGPNRVTLAPRLDGTGAHEVRVEVLPDAGTDTRLENNAEGAVVVAADAPRVLVLEHQGGAAAGVAATLAADGLRVETRSVASIPPTIAPLEQFDAVVLVNVPATALTLDQQRTLQLLVREEGRGLLAVGGPLAFGLGGYEDTVLDDVLPVSSKPPPLPREGSVSLILVLDRSSSMELVSRTDESKLTMARQAAAQAIGLLQPGDVLGVVAFDTQYEWVVPPARVRGPDDLRTAQAQVMGIRGGGGTTIFDALQAGYEAARNADTQLKHVVLLTDGQSSHPDYPGLVNRMHADQVTLSTVAIGSDADTKLLADLARLGGGRSYFTERAAQIPRIATKETTILTRKLLVEGQVAALPRDESPLLRGVDGALPDLRGYVATTPRNRAVSALVSEQGDPLLAHWQYGLGRVVAWTSDVRGPWSDAWGAGVDLPAFLGQAVRWSAPAPDTPGWRTSVALDGSRATLAAESLGPDGAFQDLSDVRATVVDEHDAAREVRLPQTAPGSYAQVVDLDRSGPYRVLFAERDRRTGFPIREEVGGFWVDGAEEARAVGVNASLLGQLAERTGGRALREPADLLAPGPGLSAAEDRLPLWPWLVALAALLLPLDVALRSLPARPWRRRS